MAKQPQNPPVEKIRPIHTIRHRNIKVTIWKNQTKNGPMYDVTATRSFMEDEVWRESHTFGYDHLLVVAKLLNDAHTFITAERMKDRATAPRNPKRREDPKT